jgi:hypothetical protein
MPTTPTKTKVNALLSAIGRQPIPAPTMPPESTPQPPKASKRAASPRVAPVADAPGKYTSIYINAEDEKILRVLSAWLAGQGKRVNDTLVIRAALRAAKTGHDLLAAYETAAHSDRRFKKKD